MDYPITPTFFRKVGIYQRLADADSGFKHKNIWEAEKVVLRWSVSIGHQLIGSPINKTHVQDILNEKINEGIKNKDNRIEKLFDYAISFPNNLLEALVMHGFAEVSHNASGSDYQVRFTPDGFMAGQILTDTQDLSNALIYKIAVGLWWPLLFIGAVILIRQAFPNLFQQVWTYFLYLRR